tara:strand:+ start:1923 stop:2555 length:633 start_codon:yes stop_codon:yes gene_type:complete
MKKKPEKKFTIEGLFPTPIYLSSLEKAYSKKELSFFKKNLKNNRPNTGNFTSNDNYVLNNPCLKNLKKNLEEHVKIYFKNVINSKNKIKPYITQSWLNITKKEQYHHKHKHNNSIISAVLYIDANEKYDSINFHRDDKYDMFHLSPKEYNVFNAGSWTYPVFPGQLIMFPSYVEHSVSKKEHPNSRMSLSFNVFVKGSIGEEMNLTKLDL